MLEEVIKSLVLAMGDLAASNRELAAAYAGGKVTAVEVRQPETEVKKPTDPLNLDELEPAQLFLLVSVYGDKALTVGDLEEVTNNPPSKKLTGIADKLTKAHAARKVDAKLYGSVLIEIAQIIMDNLDELKTQKAINEFWNKLEFAKPGERRDIKPGEDKEPDLDLGAGDDLDLGGADDTPDYEALRNQGAELVPVCAKKDRSKLVDLLKKYKCVTPENKLSFGAASDEVLPELVEAMDALANA